MRAWLERWLSPGLGTCYRCRRPWKSPATRRTGHNSYRQLGRDRFFGLVGVKGHATPYGNGSGCFPLCEACWSALTPEGRLPYYAKLVALWNRQGPPVEDEKVASIIAAVLEGK